MLNEEVETFHNELINGELDGVLYINPVYFLPNSDKTSNAIKKLELFSSFLSILMKHLLL